LSNCLRQFEIRTLAGRFQPTTAVLYPRLQIMTGDLATFTAPTGYALIGVQLSTTLLNYGTNLAGILLIIGQTAPQLAVSNSLKQVTSHITQQNSLVGPPVVPIPTSKCTSDSFGLFAYPMPAGTPISLYAFADATAGNDLFAMASLKMARMA
jgi:hypothetical protein